MSERTKDTEYGYIHRIILHGYPTASKATVSSFLNTQRHTTTIEIDPVYVVKVCWSATPPTFEHDSMADMVSVFLKLRISFYLRFETGSSPMLNGPRDSISLIHLKRHESVVEMRVLSKMRPLFFLPGRWIEAITSICKRHLVFNRTLKRLKV